MGILRVALLQMTAAGTDQAANVAKGEEYCRRAAAMGAEIVLFPEMWNIGYAGYCDLTATPETDLWRAPELWAADETNLYEQYREARERWQARAVPRNGEYVRHFRRLARELGIAIAITYLEEWHEGADAPRNVVSLIDRHGELALTYAKVHTCDFDLKEAALTPGDDFSVAALDTTHGPVQVGAMICFDREFPESARVLMLRGAELILIPNACEMERHRTAQLSTRAIENMVAVALANYAAPQENGHSMAFDPIAFADGHSRDNLVVEAGKAEGIYLAPFDLDALREYRARESWGDAYRRPHRYAALTAPDVRPPFLRVNERGEPYPRGQR